MRGVRGEHSQVRVDIYDESLGMDAKQPQIKKPMDVFPEEESAVFIMHPVLGVRVQVSGIEGPERLRAGDGARATKLGNQGCPKPGLTNTCSNNGRLEPARELPSPLLNNVEGAQLSYVADRAAEL